VGDSTLSDGGHVYRGAMTSSIDEYIGSRPADYPEMVELTLEPAAGHEPRSLRLRLTLASPRPDGGRLLLVFDGVSSLAIGDLSAGLWPYLSITSTADRGWENPRFLVEGDQGRVRFGCQEFSTSLLRPGDIRER
jgi:hypothetical protein